MTVSLDSFAEAYSRRLRAQTLAHVPLIIGLSAAVAGHAGITAAMTFTVGCLAVEVALITAVVLVGRWREDRRRAAGRSPSWSSMASRTVLQRATSHATPDSRDMGEVRGRLVFTSAGFCWVTTAEARKLPPITASVTWPAQTQIEVRRVWGPAQPGLVRLTTSSGSDDIITVWRTQDLMGFIPTTQGR